MNLCSVICSKKCDFFFLFCMHDSPNLSVSGVWADGIKADGIKFNFPPNLLILVTVSWIDLNLLGMIIITICNSLVVASIPVPVTIFNVMNWLFKWTSEWMSVFVIDTLMKAS